MSRIFNFSAGPSTLPEAVLQVAQQEMLDWQQSGMSVMEISHRGKAFMAMADDIRQDLSELLSIPSNYKILFLQGGASAQFALIPQNILADKTTACYANTGAWSKKAIQQAAAYCQVLTAADGASCNYTAIPDYQQWQVASDCAYLHYTDNETIHGVEFPDVPPFSEVPLVCDMSSNILSRPVEVSKFGIIYAGTQKNIGAAGVTVVIVRDDLLGVASPATPFVFDYAKQAASDSMLNTPATYNWYLLGLVLKWLKNNGGIAAITAKNQNKAAKLYQAIDQSSLYSNPVEGKYRSKMNVPFVLADSDLDAPFLAAAASHGLHALKGHRAVGGMRASIYNAMPQAGVDALVDFMQEFERTLG